MAFNLLKRFNDNPIRFFDTEALARDWLVKRRREVRRELSLPDIPDPPGNSDSASP